MSAAEGGEPGGGGGAPRDLELRVPAAVARRLKQEALDAGCSVNRLVLLHLRRLGYPVSEDDLRDRRRGPRTPRGAGRPPETG